MLRFSVFVSVLILSTSLIAKDDIKSDFEKVRDAVFWPKLYKGEFETLYCGVKKEGRGKVKLASIYPISWIAKANGCKNRKKCDTDAYHEASSDLHNLYPSIEKYNKSRGNLPFGEILDEESRLKDSKCDYKRTTGKDAVVEPRDAVKGEIARSILYMIHWYNLPSKDLLPLMIKWHCQYPPSKAEKLRQDKIEELQGRRNDFVVMGEELCSTN